MALAKPVRHCRRLVATSTDLRQLSAPRARNQARVFFVFFEMSLPRSVRPREICYRSYDLRLNADVQLPRLFFVITTAVVTANGAFADTVVAAKLVPFRDNKLAVHRLAFISACSVPHRRVIHLRRIDRHPEKKKGTNKKTTKTRQEASVSRIAVTLSPASSAIVTASTFLVSRNGRRRKCDVTHQVHRRPRHFLPTALVTRHLFCFFAYGKGFATFVYIYPPSR